MMSWNRKYRMGIKFCKIRITASETYQLMQIAFGDVTISQTLIFKWFRNFKEG